MTLSEFQQTLGSPEPPPELSVYAQSLWQDAKDDWEKAHALIQDLPGAAAAQIHAYLHRKEGDNGNAAYWYRRAGQSFPTESLQEEWETLVVMFL